MAGRRADADLFLTRIGDEDRDACIQQLGDQHGRGRLSTDELDQRLDLALQARTQADLAGLLSDLPTTAPGQQRIGAGVRGRMRSTGITTAAAAGVLASTGWGYYVLEHTNNFAGAAFLGCTSGVAGVLVGRAVSRLDRSRG